MQHIRAILRDPLFSLREFKKEIWFFSSKISDAVLARKAGRGWGEGKLWEGARIDRILGVDWRSNTKLNLRPSEIQQTPPWRNRPNPSYTIKSIQENRMYQCDTAVSHAYTSVTLRRVG
eukprot:162156-Amorphochlora_amoeboformis.AAC.1